jgi:hypothetical protein
MPDVQMIGNLNLLDAESNLNISKIKLKEEFQT